MENSYCVYCHTSPSGKKYIGQTKYGDSPEIRWGDNGEKYKTQQLFWRAIQKYGWDNFTHEILAEGLSEDEAVTVEENYILEYNTLDQEFGYNNRHAGSTGKLTEDAKQRMIEKQKGKHWSPETEFKPGNKRSQESIEKTAAKHRGKRIKNRNKNSKTWTCSDETKQKLRDAWAKRKNDGPTGKKAVLRVLTGEVFDSISFASEMTGISSTVIRSICYGNIFDGDEIFRIVDRNDYPNIITKSRVGSYDNSSRCKPIVCTTTGQIFGSVAIASRQLPVCYNSIVRVLKGEYPSVKGLSFEYINNEENEINEFGQNC